MKLRAKLATFTSALCLAGASFAGQQFECPSISAIKAEGISMVVEIYQSYYIGYHVSQYNTDQSWGFALLPIAGESEDVALESSNEILENMSSQGVPEQDQEGTMTCVYDTGVQDVVAMAMLASDQQPQPQDFVRKLSHR